MIFGSFDHWSIAIYDLLRDTVRECALDSPLGVVTSVVSMKVLKESDRDLLVNGWCRKLSRQNVLRQAAIDIIHLMAMYFIREDLFVLHKVRHSMRMKRLNSDRLFEWRKGRRSQYWVDRIDDTKAVEDGSPPRKKRKIEL